jgi:2-keto-4-pentenoate hydratase/2-oxohepta-3-ene-1,7-dioic acid hydratase in catechol pathway
MQLLTFKADGGLRLGVKTAAGVIDVASASSALGVSAPASVSDAIAGGTAGLADLVAKASGKTGAWLLDESTLSFGPCLPDPGKIICVGLNYRKHAEESGAAIPTTPVLFSKFSNTLAGHGDSVVLPRGVAEQYDYEVEIAVVIGKTAKSVSKADALNYVFGYCTADDISVRDLQTRTSQWLLGKTMDNFFPIGPYLVTADEVGDPQKLQLTTKVNGELRQNSNTADMIFNIAEIISYITTYFPLLPGDIITTGTPEGVAMGMPNKPWLQPGDEVVVEVEKLGALRNVMSA